MNNAFKNEQVIENTDNHFFDVETPLVLSGEELQAVSGGANCSYLGVQDWKLMMSYSSRNYSC